jgi:hypothetical protein
MPNVNRAVLGAQFTRRGPAGADGERPPTLGMDLLRRLNENQLKPAPNEYIEKVRANIISNCEELIELGARIRPLMDGDVQVGWIRGVHPVERKTMKRWIKSPNDFILNVLLLATTFNKDEIEAMQATEVHRLAAIVRQMGEYDASLFPYLSAFVSTQASEDLWHGKGESLTSFENRIVTMPDGMSMRIMAPPDHARTWASLCTYREQAKRRLEENFNALFVVRPWAGKSANPVANDLKAIARSLETDSIEPWRKVVRAQKAAVDVHDGWAHPGDSVDDLRREMEGMLKGDKHERLMTAWQKQLDAEADKRARSILEKRKQRGITQAGIVEERTEVMTEAQMRERQKVLRSGRPVVERRREDLETIPDDAQLAKFRRYS